MKKNEEKILKKKRKREREKKRKREREKIKEDPVRIHQTFKKGRRGRVKEDLD